MIIMGGGGGLKSLNGRAPVSVFFFPPSLSPISDIVPELTVYFVTPSLTQPHLLY